VRDGTITEAHRIALRIAATWSIHQSAAVVDTAYHMAGATAVFNANPFERRFRDMHAIAQQIQGRDSHYEDVGKAILSGQLEGTPTAR
jgi:alkylation response protein AidB-like acyl-CoA dehydrogenase